MLDSLTPTKPKALPFYIVIDGSQSMQGVKIEAVNKALKNLYLKMTNDPHVSSMAHVSIVEFSEVPVQTIPLCDLSSVVGIPTINADGPTNYGVVFEQIKNWIEIDMKALRSKGYAVYRSTVFFLTDGEPNDENWESSVDELRDKNWKFRPNIFCFGIYDLASSDIQVCTEILQRIMTMESWALTFDSEQLNQNTDVSSKKDPLMAVAHAIDKYFDKLTNTIITTASNTSEGSFKFEQPDCSDIEGAVKIPVVEIDEIL